MREMTGRKAGAATRRRGLEQVTREIRRPTIIGLILLTLVLVVGGTLGATAVSHVIGIHTNNTAITFMVGFLLATGLFSLVGSVAILSGGVNWITGSWAEDSTGALLKHLGPDCRVIHNVPFTVGDESEGFTVDVDHVAVGSSYVLAIESKYTSTEIDLGATRPAIQLAKDMDQARRVLGECESCCTTRGLTRPLRLSSFIGVQGSSHPRAGCVK